MMLISMPRASRNPVAAAGPADLQSSVLAGLLRDLGGSRASLWHRLADGRLRCSHIWDARRGAGGGLDISDSAAQAYLAAMPEAVPVAAVDAALHPVIGLLEDEYLFPQAVLSALHVRIGDLLLWLDQCRSMRLWSGADEAHLLNIARQLAAEPARVYI